MVASSILLLLLISAFIETGNSQARRQNQCGLSSPTYPIFRGEIASLKFNLFSRAHPKDGCDLQPTFDAINGCRFNPRPRTHVIIHGWVDNLPENSLMHVMKDKILEAGDYNVIILDWTSYSGTHHYSNNFTINYDMAAINSVLAGLQVAAWIQFLQAYAGADPANFHLIAHSLGGEVASYAAKNICNLGHITFLDASAPKFRHLDKALQPSYTDALFVEEIHADGASNIDKGYGYIRPIADIDYYPNGGQQQSKCYQDATFQYETAIKGTVDSQGTVTSCRHDSVINYYIASFDKNCKFSGLICDSYEDYSSGKCSSENAPLCELGFYSKRLPELPPHSKCYLNTTAEAPYCLN